MTVTTKFSGITKKQVIEYANINEYSIKEKHKDWYIYEKIIR